MPIDWLKIATADKPKQRGAIAAGLSSGVDDLQGIGYSALAAGADALGATGARDWLNERADLNQWESQRNGRPDLERIEDQTFGSALPYLGYQIAKQVPNLAASIGAGLAVPEVAVPAMLSRGLAVGPRALGMGGMSSRVAAATEAGTSQFAARRAALEAGQTFGKQLVGGGAVNYAQGVGSLYQEANDGGDPNAGWSAIAGGLPYALTETLPEAMLVGRIGHGTGFRGGLPTRMAKAGLTQGAAGATSEGLQNEMEMAYNGNVSDEQAFSRRLNSMTAGGLVEGVLGLGGGIRSRGPAVKPNGKIDLLGTDSWSTSPGAGVETQQTTLPADPLGDLTPDWTTSPGAGGATVADTVPTTGLVPAIDEPSFKLGAGPSPGAAERSLAMPAVEGRPDLADTMLVGRPGEVAQTDADNAAMLDPGTELARKRAIEQMEAARREEEVRRQAAQVTEQTVARDKRAESFGVKGTAAVEVFSQLEDARAAGIITDGQFAENVGLLAARKAGAVRKFLEGTKATKDAIAASDAAPVAAVASPAGQNAVAPAPQPTTTVGRAGRKQEVTKDQLLAKITAASPADKARILAVTGMEVTNDPATGRPMMVQTGQPMSFAEVAAEEEQRTGKPVTRQAIQQALAKFGITEDVATQVAATQPTNVSAEELGIDPTAPESSGYRVEERVSKATGAGMVNTAEDAQLTPVQQRQVEAGLKAVRQGGFTPAAIAQATKGLGQAAKGRLLQLAAKEMERAAPAPAPSQAAVKAPAGAKVVDLRDENEARIAANIKAILQLQVATEAKKDWEGNTPWAELPDTLQAEWVEAYEEELERGDGQLDQKAFHRLDIVQTKIDHRYEDFKQSAAGAANPSDTRRIAGDEGLARGAGPGSAELAGSPDQGTGAYVGEAGQRVGDAAKPVVTVKKTRKIAQAQGDPSEGTEGSPTASAGQKFSTAEAGEKSSVVTVFRELNELGLKDKHGKVTVVQSVEDLPVGADGVRMRAAATGGRVQAFVLDGKAYLIADNIRPGTARAVFLHEVGAHLGFDKLLSKQQFWALVDRIGDWAAADDGSLESRLAQRAIKRRAAAQTPGVHMDSELLAYFVEEAVRAGIDPTASTVKGELGRWMRVLKQAIRDALEKLGFMNGDLMTAQDVVDLAYGLAHVQLSHAQPITRADLAQTAAQESVQGAKVDRALSNWASQVAKLDRRAAARRAEEMAPVVLQPTPLLKMVGMYRPLVARVSETRHAFEHPETTPTVLAQLPELLKSPRLISRRSDGSYRFVLDARDAQARPFVAAFAMTEVKGQKVFILKTLYAHDSSAKSITAEARDGRVLYASDEGLARLQDLLPAGTIPEGTEPKSGARQAQGSGANLSSVLTEAALAKFTAGDQSWRQETRAVRATDADVVRQDRIKFSVADDAPREVKRAYNAMSSALSDITQKGALWASFTKDLAARAAKVIPSAKTYVDLVGKAAVAKTRSERAVEAVLDGFADLPAHERGTGPGSVNAFLHDSTYGKKWGFKPEYHADAEVDADMAARFKALSPAAQKLVQDVFRHGNDTLQRLRAAVMDNVTSEHDAAIRAAESLGDAEKLKEAQEAKVKSLKDYENLFSFGGNWPYAPLKRFGNQVVVAVSKAYIDAERAGDRDEMRRLQSDGRHYHVEFTETKREAQTRAAELRASGQFGEGGMVQDFERDGVQDAMYGGRDTLNAFRRLRSLVEDSQDEHLSAKSAKALKALMSDLHLTLLGEASARQAERNRANVAGADKDMMRAFATQGRATAHFIASLETSGQVADVLSEMKAEADARTEGRRERRDYYNELLKRHVMGLEYSPSPLVEKAMGATSLWMLLTSPAYFLTNATQPFAMSLPVMAGKHGYGAAASALTRAYRDLMPLLKNGAFKESDYSKLPSDVVDGVQKLADRGFIDISLEQDLGRWRSLDDGPTRHVDKAVAFLRRTAQGVESANRLSTAIAALRLAKAKGLSSDAAADYAGQVIYDTHGDYTGFNSPRVMRSGVGRLLTQFRKFQLIQISLFTKMARESLKGATAEDRRVARAALGWSLGHMMALGGLLGMPGAQAVGWVLRHTFGDDDEPDDPELTLRRLIGDEAMADLLIKGVPKLMGVDLSGRVGAGGMLSLLPYGEVPTDRKSYEATVVQALGPFLGGLLPKFADGVGLVHQGEWVKGMEQFLPTGFANLAKGIRMGTQGMTQRNGDMVMSPDEISVLDGAMQALGLPTNTMTDRSFRAEAKYKSDSFFKERSSSVQRAYLQGYRSGDAAAMAEARQEWVALQEARVRNGYKREPLSTLLRAPLEQRKRERQAVGGIEYGRQNRGFVQELDDIS